METLTLSKQLTDVMGIIEKYGPEENEYTVLNKIVNNITREEEIQIFIDFIKPILNENTMFGHAFVKPLGYAGDYLLIEKMYQQHVSNDLKYCKWDKYYHSQEAAKAVRNRKTYFIKIMEQLCFKRPEPLKILILGSGPATDVFEFLTKNPNANVMFNLLDFDQRAIDYAADKNKNYLNKIRFIKMNVLRFMPEHKYDLIWSAGLFDYLNDRLFIGLVHRFKNNLSIRGEIIIGNFSPYNPRKAQEILCDWHLILRSSQQLRNLAVKAGLPRQIIEVDKEPLGINLFLRIKPDKLKVSLQNVSSLQYSEKSDL